MQSEVGEARMDISMRKRGKKEGGEEGREGEVREGEVRKERS